MRFVTKSDSLTITLVSSAFKNINGEDFSNAPEVQNAVSIRDLAELKSLYNKFKGKNNFGLNQN